MNRFAGKGILLLQFCICALLLSGCGSWMFKSIYRWEDQVSTSAQMPANLPGVIKSAISQIGRPYRAGGSTPRGFDCSGLVWWAYRQNGITIPRRTIDQAQAGISVASRAVRAGDILVFKVRESSTGLHTGLYAGDGKFVHSPSSGSHVRLDQINSTYWSKRLYQIRRIAAK